jgi:CRP/FNR family transcriptional regulator, nitrogen fixation regulation protein
MEVSMFRQFSSAEYADAPVSSPSPAELEQFGALAALDQLGVRCRFTQDEEIYGELDAADCWYKVISGTVRICRLLADGRRHIAQFCFAGDRFGLDAGDERLYAAEAVGNVTIMRFSRNATERLIDARPQVARQICDMTLRHLAHAQARMLLLGRMTACERVAQFLLELAERQDARILDVPMSRNDIGDYLGLTIETVCRVLSGFRRDGLIAIPTPHRIELRDRGALEILGGT